HRGDLRRARPTSWPKDIGPYALQRRPPRWKATKAGRGPKTIYVCPQFNVRRLDAGPRRPSFHQSSCTCVRCAIARPPALTTSSTPAPFGKARVTHLLARDCAGRSPEERITEVAPNVNTL